MTTTQLAKSDCVATPDDVATIGCTVSSRFQGTIELAGAKTEFHVVAPAIDGNSQLRLESAAFWKGELATVAALYFTWVYNGRFERTAVLVRLR